MENYEDNYIDRYFEFHDGESHKFFRIQLNECEQTLWCGAIGTAGEITMKSYGNMKQAQQAVATLIREKEQEGYRLMESPGLKIKRRKFTAHDEPIVDQLQRFITTPEAESLTHLVIGYWEEASAEDSSHITDFLIAHTDTFPSLTSIFIGDMGYEDSEISWIKHHDLSPLLHAYPGLTELIIKGSDGLVLGELNHANLEMIRIECGGLDARVIDSISRGTLPSLCHLELYMGDPYYGWNGTIENIKPFTRKGLFPHLTYIGLKNSTIADEIAIEITRGDILEQIISLDLSLGILSDTGGEALFNCPAVAKLRLLDCTRHYMTRGMMKKLKSLESDTLTVRVGDAQAPDIDYDDEYNNIEDIISDRYVAVRE